MEKLRLLKLSVGLQIDWASDYLNNTFFHLINIGWATSLCQPCTVSTCQDHAKDMPIFQTTDGSLLSKVAKI